MYQCSINPILFIYLFRETNRERIRILGSESNNVIIIFRDGSRGEKGSAARKTNRRGARLSGNKSKGTSGIIASPPLLSLRFPLLNNRSTKSEGTVNERREEKRHDPRTCAPRHDPKKQVVCRYLHTMSTDREPTVSIPWP